MNAQRKSSLAGTVLRGTPLHEDVETVLEKLEQRTSASAAGTQSPMRACIAYVPDGGTKLYDDKQDVIDALHDGILRQRVVGYVYRDGRGRTQRGRLAAHAMLLYRQGLYIVGARLAAANADRETTSWRKRLGVFAVERFTEAEALRERFDVPADFRLDDVLHGAFGIHVRSDGESHRVVIDFSSAKATLVRARVWHPTQHLDDLSDGGVRFTFSCANLTPVVSWVLEWGPARARRRAR